MVLIDSATDLIAMESDLSRSTSSVSKPQWRPEYSNAWSDIYLKGIVIKMFLMAQMFLFFKIKTSVISCVESVETIET